MPNAAVYSRYANIWKSPWNQTTPGKLNKRMLMDPKGKNITKARAAMMPCAISIVVLAPPPLMIVSPLLFPPLDESELSQ